MLFSDLSLSEFIDAVMVFGAVLEPRRASRRAAIRISRKLEQRRSLAWMIAMIEQHDVPMSLCETSNDDIIIYRSRPLMFALREHARWYGPGGQHPAEVPDDLRLSLPLLVTWATAALSDHEPVPERLIKFTAPKLSRKPLLVDRLSREATALGLHLLVSREDELYLPGESRDELGAWLSEQVPRAVWDSSFAVEVD